MWNNWSQSALWEIFSNSKRKILRNICNFFFISSNRIFKECQSKTMWNSLQREKCFRVFKRCNWELSQIYLKIYLKSSKIFVVKETFWIFKNWYYQRKLMWSNWSQLFQREIFEVLKKRGFVKLNCKIFQKFLSLCNFRMKMGYI